MPDLPNMAFTDPAWWQDKNNWRNTRWRAQPDDLIGGWCVSLEDDKRTPAEGSIQLGEFISEDVAQHMADCHNTWLMLYEANRRAEAMGL